MYLKISVVSSRYTTASLHTLQLYNNKYFLDVKKWT
jgi:hypothetical protein